MQRKNKRAKRFFCLFIALLLLFGWLLHAPLAVPPVKGLIRGELGFSRFTAQIKEAYGAHLFGKTALVDLGGAFARLIGRRSYHGVSVLDNGMLDYDALEETDTAALGGEIVALRDRFAQMQTPFLFVSVPCKTDSEKTLVGAYQVHYGVENAAALVAQIEKMGVDTLDLRPKLARDASAVERYFYRTDHHWNTDGAFLAAQSILEHLSKTLKREVDLSALDSAEWHREVYQNWFLGSHGKRVGRFFGGVDDLFVYTPRYPTKMQMEIPLHGAVFEGDFEETVLRKEYLDSPDYFAENPYVCYIGGDYPLVVHRNGLAKNDLSVLLIKDSFSIPVQAFLSTALSRLDVIDPRYLRGERVEDYIEEGKYDVVILMINPSVYEDVHYQNLLK